MRKIEVMCYSCKKMLGDFGFKTYGNAYKGVSTEGKRELFCNEVCYNEYWDKHLAEVYNGENIYWIKAEDRKMFIPYIGCSYAFENIEDCKKRMRDKHIAIM